MKLGGFSTLLDGRHLRHRHQDFFKARAATGAGADATALPELLEQWKKSMAFGEAQVTIAETPGEWVDGNAWKYQKQHGDADFVRFQVCLTTRDIGEDYDKAWMFVEEYTFGSSAFLLRPFWMRNSTDLYCNLLPKKVTLILMQPVSNLDMAILRKNFPWDLQMRIVKEVLSDPVALNGNLADGTIIGKPRGITIYRGFLKWTSPQTHGFQ